MKKRVLAFLLVLVMLCGMVPVGAMAASVVDSGQCGDNVYWTFYSDGLLTISGAGEMWDYESILETGEYDEWLNAPWFRYRVDIEKIVIEDGVTSVGNHAFTLMYSVESVTIPSGITNIGVGAFYNCITLTSITIPTGTISIGDDAFRNCYSLINVEIPYTVISIGNGAFYGCESLVSITVPMGIDKIGNATFGFCNSLTSITIPYGVISIGKRAFIGCSGLESIAIPDSVTSIGEYAFNGCGFVNITIPDSVTSIEGYAFCYCSSLVSISIPDRVTSVGEGMFMDCDSLTSITIPSSVTSIGDHAFYRCKSLINITIPSHVISIGDYAFDSCYNLIGITIPASITSIGDNAFAYCNRLEDVYYSGTEAKWNTITIGENNSDLLDATIHFVCNHSFPAWQDVGDGVNHKRICRDCGEVEYAEHIWNSGTEDAANNQKIYKCTQCGATKTEPWKPGEGGDPGEELYNPFVDVHESDWFYSDVLAAYHRGLVNGVTPTTYEPHSDLRISQAIKLAACMHQLYHEGAVSIEAGQGNDWYVPYVEYCMEKGIISIGFPEYDMPINRRQFIEIFYNALPESEYKAINYIPDGSISDVQGTSRWEAMVYAFYRAGILTGYTSNANYNAHDFGPYSNISRAEVATIMNRMFDASARVKFTIE